MTRNKAIQSSIRMKKELHLSTLFSFIAPIIIVKKSNVDISSSFLLFKSKSRIVLMDINHVNYSFANIISSELNFSLSFGNKQ